MKRLKILLFFCVTILFWIPISLSAADNSVVLIDASEKSFYVKSGEYTISYNPTEPNAGWVLIGRDSVSGKVIGTKFANGAEFNPTDIGDTNVYNWNDPRKDNKILKSIKVAESADKIEIKFDSERRWATMDSRLTVYKNHPGLLRWSVKINAKSDKSFYVVPEQECRFMTAEISEDRSGYLNDPKHSAHDVVRYMHQRGPATGILYFNDRSMKSTVFYLQDYTSLNELYKLTGFANPFEHPSEGQTGSVKIGKPWHDFQNSRDGDTVIPPKPFDPKIEQIWQFGYERPYGFRVPKGSEIIIADAYLYLKPDEASENNVSICKNFTEALATVYKYIGKPKIEKTDWAGEVVPRMIKDINREENNALFNEKYLMPRAYVSYEHKDYQLWTLAQLLHPLIEYVKKYPNHKEALELKQRLEKSLPVFYDKEYKGFHNNIPPLNPNMYFHSVYLFIPAMMVADIALLGNEDAKQMILGYRDRLLELGKKTGYVFGDVWLDDYSSQNFYYQMDETGGYIYLMMAIYELSGNTDKEALESAKAAAEKLTDRCMDLGWQVNITATGAVGCEKLYKATENDKYRELAYIPLANTLRQAWLWESDYGVGEKTATFWAFCGTPAAPSSAEFETHRTRYHLKQYLKLAKDHLSADMISMLKDSSIYGQMQSRYTLPPYLVQSGASRYMAAEGKTETDCGDIRYDQMIPLEDVRVGWCTDLEWWNNNAKLGVVGQEIYGAGGMIWYAVWQDEQASQ